MHKPYNTQLLANEILEQNPVMVAKIANACKIDELQVPVVFEEVLKFLWLIGALNQKLTPSLITDNAWHEFILFTRLYHRFCDKHFGRYIHHSPGGNENENRRNYSKTIQLYILHFGQPPELYWGHLATEKWIDSQCGSCSN
ncbi:MAG: glycine-rich domain-containing protein [Bacteroidia bacterium]